MREGERCAEVQWQGAGQAGRPQRQTDPGAAGGSEGVKSVVAGEAVTGEAEVAGGRKHGAGGAGKCCRMVACVRSNGRTEAGSENPETYRQVVNGRCRHVAAAPSAGR